MKIIVMGAGVVGVSTAYQLARDGHEVTVIDRQLGPGLETSFANGGQVSASHAEPWANPSTPAKALSWIGKEDAPLAFRWARWDPPLWAWGLRFLRNCTAARARINTERTLRVALYSRAALLELRAETGIRYDHGERGILHIYRDRRGFERACRAAEIMADNGLSRTAHTASECVTIEPALGHAAGELAGGLYSPADESGDAYLFTIRLAELAATAGVAFRFGETVVGLEARGGRIVGVRTDAGVLAADIFVLALGSFSPRIAGTVGIALPIYPAKGYSITVETSGSAAPTVSITDDERKMVYSRLGERLRAAGTAEFAGWDASATPVRVASIVRNARALFPAAGDFDAAITWAGLRPKTPDSVPIIGWSPVANLLLNTGHGTLGWTMATGSARIVAALVAGRAPEIDIRGLGLDRY